MTTGSSPTTVASVSSVVVETSGDPRWARRARGLLGRFNTAGVLTAADVHVAARLGRLGGEDREEILLAVALAVRAVRHGSVCVELAAVGRTVLGEGEELVDTAQLPWPEPDGWARRCVAGPLVADGPTAPARPLRLVDGLLYLERYWQEEELIRTTLARRAAAGPPPVDQAVLAAGLAERFGAADAAGQRRAAAVGVLRRVSVLAGGPGTGKTTTVAGLLALLAAQPGGPWRIAMAAPTGKAAARLQEAVAAQLPDGLPTPTVDPSGGGLSASSMTAPTSAVPSATTPGTTTDTAGARTALPQASTLHRLLGWRPGGRFRYGPSQRLPFDVVVVDEASMVSLSMMARLLQALRPQTRLILVGDPDQLASVEAGAVLGDLARAPGAPEPALDAALARLGLPGGVVHGVVTLEHVWRFGGAIAAFARAVQAGDADTAVALLRSDAPDLQFVDTGDGTQAQDRTTDRTTDGTATVRADVVAAGRALRAAAAAGDVTTALAVLDEHRVLCAHRRGPYGVARWTAEIERWLGPVGAAAEPGPWYPGRPVLVTANDPDTGLFNGDTGVAVTTPQGLRVAFARGGPPTLHAPARLAEVATVHAMTVHRGQGSQFRRVTVVLPPPESPLLTRELLYTAITRARETVRVIGTEAAVRAAVARPVARASGLRHRLADPLP